MTNNPQTPDLTITQEGADARISEALVKELLPLLEVTKRYRNRYPSDCNLALEIEENIAGELDPLRLQLDSQQLRHVYNH